GASSSYTITLSDCRMGSKQLARLNGGFDMLRRKRNHNLATSLILAVALLTSAAAQAAAGSKPTKAVRSARGFNAVDAARQVTIYRDEFGVPHIYGPTDASCVFGYIYAQAEDNFWQIEDSYIRSLGRASEYYGERAVNDDLLNRALEIPRLAKSEYEHSNARAKLLCDAMADGLNYFLERNPQVKPRLITHFEPWYVFAFNRYAIYQIFIFGKTGLRLEEVRKAVTEVTGSGTPASSGSRTNSEEQAESSLDDQPNNGLEPMIGSNMWAVTPQKTSNGHAMLL